MNKEEIRETNFICDECQASLTTKDGFPYSKGWVYIYNFNFQVKPVDENSKRNWDRLELKDKHFCSEGCMLAHISKEIKGGVL